jgi:hypothetical protein
MLFAANIILGMGIGFMEAPIMTYLGETCQPQIRALITSFPGLFVRPKYNVFSGYHKMLSLPWCNYLYPTDHVDPKSKKTKIRLYRQQHTINGYLQLAVITQLIISKFRFI